MFTIKIVFIFFIFQKYYLPIIILYTLICYQKKRLCMYNMLQLYNIQCSIIIFSNWRKSFIQTFVFCKVLENIELNKKSLYSRVPGCQITTYYYVGYVNKTTVHYCYVLYSGRAGCQITTYFFVGYVNKPNCTVLHLG